ncbi:ABC transporter permease [Paenibacillus segetis]|uniref:ABC transporter permease n=2 Tax=Paenibacillus segetis TaxID=1325360 RepID=A0ABQ1Y5N0_9BACL|nr:ABC transporter permease [Paenibacillus segetis]
MPLFSFFGPNSSPKFIMFSTPHVSAIGVLLLFIFALYLWKRRIRSNRVASSAIRYALVVLLALTELGLNTWYFTNHLWDVRYTLPLELCSVTLILSIIMLLTRSKKLYQILYFAGIAGAFQALITPNLAYGYHHFRYFEYFIAHGAIVLSPLYMTWVEQYKPTWKSIGWSLLFLNALAVVVGSVNYVLGSNYMFLNHKPDTASALDLLGPYPYYLLAEEGVALLFFVGMYTLFFVFPNRRKKRLALESITTKGVES